MLLVRGRVDLLESRYSEILSLLKRQIPDGEEEESSPAATVTSKKTSQRPTAAAATAGSASSTTDTHSQSAGGLLSPAHGGFQQQPIFPAVIGSGLLSLDECESLLGTYRRMSRRNFPFVVVPECCRAASLIEERPMLAQAIFMVTSWRQPARQAVLHTDFLREVGDRYFVKFERSLDLLQSLLVYFGWSVLFFARESEPAPVQIRCVRTAP